ncbi:MAG: zinc ribbon domain-containing protein, partial [Candidatus Lokiarchaeota archaeon]
FLKSSQLGINITLDIIKPELFMVEGHIWINITSENAGNVHIALTEQSEDRYFMKINQSLGIVGSNESQEIIIRAIPLITTSPGKYHFTLNITGLFQYNETFTMFLGMGYSVFTILLGFIAVISILFMLKRRHTKKVKTSQGEIPSQSSQTAIVGKITCPNCKKWIDEGLSFCPDCGERIPEFLRYNLK